MFYNLQIAGVEFEKLGSREFNSFKPSNCDKMLNAKSANCDVERWKSAAHNVNADVTNAGQSISLK